ncbi:MAG: tetratricopeptide repeat protein [Candidatus Omnitrophica bacterium]|nr:tetratricopeptide repeat protein [Candidatus Omnitrophota bacterium]
MQNKWLKILLLAGVVLLCYSNTFHAPFQYDDYIFVSGNPNIRDLTDIKALWHSQPQYSRFVATVSFALNYHFGKLNVFGYHVVNLLIHLMNGLLVWWLIKLLMATPGLNNHKLSKYKDNIGWVSALLFIAHPLQTEAVTYICQRYASLATLFYLLAMGWYLKARLSGQKKFFVMCAVSALLGMFTKEFTMTLPVMIIMTEWMMFEHKKWDWKNTVLFGLVLLGFLMIVPALMRFNFFWAIFEPKPSSSHIWDVITLVPYVMTQLKVWVVLLGKVLIPIHQNLDYDFPLVHNFGQIDVWGSAVILLGLLIFAIIYYRKNLLVSYGIMWFFVAMSIEMVPRIYVIFEHKMYLPLAGLCMAFTSLWQDKVEDDKVRIIIMTTLIVAFGFLTFQRNAVWKSTLSLWADTVSHSPDKPSANHMLAYSYIESGDLDTGMLYLEKTLSIDRFYFKAIYNRAFVYLERGQLDKALKELNECLRLSPTYSRAYVKRGLAYTQMGNIPKALEDYAKGMELEPRFSGAYLNRGVAYYKIGEFDLAIKDFSKAIALDPDLAGAYFNRFSAYKSKGETQKALNEVLYITKNNMKLNPEQIAEMEKYLKENLRVGG